MGRKRKSKSDDGGVSLDSLMDALTNVVAVLILVLILVQADVVHKKVKFMQELLPATAEEVAGSTQKLVELSKKKQSMEKLLTGTPPTDAEVEAEMRQLALFEKDTLEKKAALAEITELRKLMEKVSKERDGEKAQTTKIQTEIARLESLLDDSPVVKLPATEIRIPISKDIPKSAVIYRAIILDDRLHFIDPFTPVEQFENEFKRNKRKWIFKRKGGGKYIYDKVKIVEHFKGFNHTNSRLQKISLITKKTWSRVGIEIRPDFKKGGTPLAKLNDKDSIYAKALQKLARDSRAVIFYFVHPNSFHTYIQARKMADDAGVAAGWRIQYLPQYTVVVDDLEVQRVAPPKVAPKPPKPPGPPPIGPKLD